MKIAVASSDAEQIAQRNIAGTQGWPYFDFADWRGIREYNPDMLVLLGWYVDSPQKWWMYKHFIGDIGKVAVLWAGSDILMTRSFMDNGQRTMIRDLQSDRFCHIPETEYQRDELLKLFNITAADPLPAPVPKCFEAMPMPDEFTVSAYCPTSRFDFYRLGMIGDALKDTGIKLIWYHFLFCLAEMTYPGPDERRFAMTRAEYEQTIADSSCGVRIPEHDGLSVGASEFLMAGRPVISCHDMPRWPAMVRGEVTAEKVKRAIDRVKAGDVVPEGVQKFYRDLFDPAQYATRLGERLDAQWKCGLLAG